jgi:hypothetical protein
MNVPNLGKLSLDVDKKRNAKSLTIGTATTIVGFLLSPLSWWNDLILNIPLAYLFGSLFGLLSEKLMLPMFVVGYWITNILGLLMMHNGVGKIVKPDKKSSLTLTLIVNMGFSVIYTIAIVILVEKGLLKFPWEYFK